MQPSTRIVMILTGLITTTVLSVANATSAEIPINMICPVIAKQGPHVVINDGTSLSGTGTERIGTNAPTTPLFKSALPSGSAMPVDLAAAYYRNAGADYDGATSTVICHFTSAIGYTPFHLTYKLNNGYGGVVKKASHNEIDIVITLGIHKYK